MRTQSLANPSPVAPPSVSAVVAAAVSPTLESAELFQGSSLLRIAHRGETYLLRVTRQGKLLLTK
ncbi:hemin uptake protein HemP [Neomegalonema sp.]|uniref:hemin uptake protein HemP n=1 Tax=Neomegalonema sp. TaxID=2039713 RepID=UPI00260DF27E|nr:hemin uptake protein HemP [Neomegalonema sp.]MDD2867511.1 hemin uptake protein HemP [Neomegalonema sp.]